MNNMYNRIAELCKEANTSPSRMCLDLQLSKSLITELKAGRSKRLSLDTTQKIADKFSVPISFLTGAPPFDHWDEINSNRAQFFHYVDLDPDLLDLAYGIDSNLLDAEPIKPIIDFLAEQVESAQPLENGEWAVKMKNNYGAKKAPTPQEGERSTAQTDDEEEMLLLARHMEPLPEEDREVLKAQFKSAIDVYLNRKAQGASGSEDK